MMDVPKPAGGTRHVCVYQIPDSAVSNYLYHKLLSKNKHRFSSLAYAYRDDRNVHYAIQDIALDFRRYPRVFISEFDFKDFFGSIDQSFLKEQFDKNGFFISTYDQKIIDAFITLNSRGIPQGTSISLFLANLVCWQLDRKLESEGLRFARYADDTVIWSNDYSKITKSFELIYDFSAKAGIPINIDKSNGIRLLVRKGTPTEFPSDKTIQSIDFLGYELTLDKIKIKQKSVKKIKQHIS
ncbi:MAG TPA: reverse transcriptase domain-containing protein, partial [Syntrophomonadaceae bacterium]|nr:reverse transcriptase domain-containing protein [Syntrophomonadaceae bacterium]